MATPHFKVGPAIQLGRLASIANADHKRFYQKPRLRKLYLLLLPTCMGAQWSNGFGSSLMNNLPTVKAWEEFFGHPTGFHLGFLCALYSLGALCGSFLVPIVARKWGRKKAILSGAICAIVGATYQGTCNGQSGFIAGRLLSGFGIPFSLVNASALLGELGYHKERATLTSVFGPSWFLGAIAAAGTTHATSSMNSDWSWRIPSLLQLTPSLSQLAFLYYIPESPRWLVYKDRANEAEHIIKEYHSEGDGGKEYVDLEMREIQLTVALEKQLEPSFTWSSPWVDTGVRHRFMVSAAIGIFVQWSGNGLMNHYMKNVLNLVGITNNRNIQRFILAHSCWALMNGLPIALIAPRYPRRKAFLTCTIGVFTVLSIITIASYIKESTKSQAAGIAVLIFILLYSPFFNIAWNSLTYTYLVELFPFSERSQGIAVEQITARLAAFFNALVNPYAMKKIGWKYYTVYCGFVLFEIAIVYKYFRETHNRTLEELSFASQPQSVRTSYEQPASLEEEIENQDSYQSHEEQGVQNWANQGQGDRDRRDRGPRGQGRENQSQRKSQNSDAV